MPKNIKIYKDIIPPKLCRQLIELFESDSNVKPDPQPDYSSRDYAKITDLSEKKWGNKPCEHAFAYILALYKLA